jgi:tetratricopeptide (TPR) repeat protein
MLAFALFSAGAEAASVENAPYEFVLAKLLAAEGAWQEAADSFDRAIALAPTDPYLRLDYAGFLLQIGRRRAALEQATEARRLAPQDPDALAVFARSQLAVADGDPVAVDRAREAYEELRRLQPGNLQGLIALGRLYLGSARTEEAAVVFREALALRPQSSWLLSLLVEAQLRSDQVAAAEQTLQSLLLADPSEARARLTLADLQQKRGDMRAAAQTLRAAPPEVMEDLDYRRRLGFALYRVGDLQAGLDVVDSVLEDDRDDFGGLYLKGLIHAAEGHHERASELLRQLLAQRPQSLELALLAARVLERQQATEEAVGLLSELAGRLRESDAEEEAELAEYQSLNILFRAGEWKRLLAELEPKLAQAPAELSLDLVFLHLDALVQTDRAAEALERLRELESPLLTPARRVAKEAELLLELEREAEAAERMAKLMELSGAEGQLEAARLLQSRERYAEAVPLLEALRQQTSDQVQLLFWLGAAYERTGRHGEAEEAFRGLLEIDSSFAPALNYLGYMWADLGRNLEEALDLAERAVALEPDNGAYVDSLGWALFRLGRYEEARTVLQRAARLVPGDAVISEHLGDLYLAVGRPAEARLHYERALSLEGENSGVVSDKLDRLRPQL